MTITGATVRIDIENPTLIELKATVGHVETATKRKPTVWIWGLFEYRGDDVWATSRPIKAIGYTRGKVRAEIDGEVLKLEPVRLDRATIAVDMDSIRVNRQRA